jgi:hypothetical protein
MVMGDKQAVSNLKFGICSEKFGIIGSVICSTTRFGITGSNQIGIKDTN